MKKKKLIFIPGFKGSFLSKKNSKKRVWLTPVEALIGKSSLELPHISSLKSEELEQDGIFEKVSLIPGIIEVDIYGRLIKFLNRFFSSIYEIIPFSYDWRRSCLDNVKQLDLFIKNNWDQSPFVLFVHSMGGLIASYYFRYGVQSLNAKENWYGTKFVDKIICCGVPFQGAPQIFLDLHKGVRTLLNKILLSSESLFSFSFLNSDGDGTVPTESAKLPNFYYNISINKEVQFSGKHRTLFNEKIARKEISNFLSN